MCIQTTGQALLFLLLSGDLQCELTEGVFSHSVTNLLKSHCLRKGEEKEKTSPVFVVYLKGSFPLFVPISGLFFLQTMPVLLPLPIFCPEHGVISDILGVLLINVAILLELTSS